MTLTQVKKGINFGLLGLLALLSFACLERQEVKSSFPDSVEGYAPIYAGDERIAQSISYEQGKTPSVAGKIYVYQNYLFLSALNEGIHIIDNSDQKNPRPLKLIRMNGNVDIAIKDGFLYADQFSDLLVFDLKQITNPVMIERIADVFPDATAVPPAPGYFECANPEKGKVIGWKKKMLTSPKCLF